MLVDDEQHHVNRNQRDDKSGQEHDVQDVQTRNDVVPWEFATEQEVRNPGSHSWDCLDHSVDDSKTVTREQVVGERVAGESFGHRENEENESDDPVNLARLAERAREEDAQHVEPDSGHEQQRRPVVNLAHQQSASDVECEVQCRGIGRRHVNPLERHVRAVVVHLDH